MPKDPPLPQEKIDYRCAVLAGLGYWLENAPRGAKPMEESDLEILGKAILAKSGVKLTEADMDGRLGVILDTFRSP
jgi:hypothetical protein